VKTITQYTKNTAAVLNIKQDVVAGYKLSAEGDVYGVKLRLSNYS
jgi:hypothetical protein